MQLDVFFDANNFMESINFGGPGADINNYLADKARMFGSRMDYELFKQVPTAFKASMDSLLAAKQQLLSEQLPDNADDPFWITEEAELLYDFVTVMNQYPGTHKYYAQVDELELPDDFYNFKANLELDREDYLKSKNYTSFIDGFVREQSGEAIAAAGEGADRNMISFETAVEVLENEAVLNTYLSNRMSGLMQWNDLAELEDEVSFFKSKVSDEELLTKFEEEYADWKKLAAGQPAIEFQGKDSAGNTIKFSDFRGKYVYVDVWATWCGPCKYEIPYLKELEADYHDRNIVFLSYSIDDDHQAWVDFIPENELGGVQIIGEKAWESKLCQDYKIRGVPTFMFFGPDGEIINVKMTRPSNQATRDQFDSYSNL